MANSLSPAFVRINYASQFGLHTMTLPTVPMLPGPEGGAGNQFQLRGAALPTDVTGAIVDFITVIKQFWPTTTTFIDFVAFVQPDPEGIATPVQSVALNIAGTKSNPGWHKATQCTFTWRTDEFGLFKLVFLDCSNFDTFDKQTSSSAYAALAALNAYVTADTTFLAGRDGGRPITFLQQSNTLNEKLRRSYGMN